MGLREDLESEVSTIFRKQWTTRDSENVPEPEDLRLGNDASKLDATVLYADMSDSTKLVDNHGAEFAAEVYKAYLVCAARIIKDVGGTITAYDGDRIMAVFMGRSKNTSAAKAALKINHAVLHIINPALKKQYPHTEFALGHVVGIDTSSLFAARIGVRNDNDIVWVGRAANYAAKLSAIDNPNTTYITEDVFDILHESAKYGGSGREPMWERRSWTDMNGMTIYRSKWWWPV
ncbi:MAG: adenylate/guanylate cyclase domain-containing protein [Polyangiaceae bacterium]